MACKKTFWSKARKIKTKGKKAEIITLENICPRCRSKIRIAEQRQKNAKKKEEESIAPKLKKPENRTSKIVLREIQILEYNRMNMPKYPHPRRAFIEERIIEKIKSLYEELGKLRKNEGKTPTITTTKVTKK